VLGEDGARVHGGHDTLPPMGRVTFALGAAVAIAAAALRVASAADAQEPIRLEFHGAPGCPDEQTFVAGVRARTARARFVTDGDARRFVVRLDGGAHASGSVTVAGPEGAEGTRSLEADTCAQVTDALALMIALAVDARPPPPPPPPAAPDAGASDAGEGASTGSLDAGVVVADTAPLAPPPVIESSPPPRRRASSAPSGPPHFHAGADFALATGVSPHVVVAGAPFVGWRSLSPVLFGVAGLSLRAAFLRAGTGRLDVAGSGGGTGDFTWTVGRLDGCAMAWPDRSLRLGGCVRIEAGALDVTAAGVPGARAQTSPWLATGGAGRLEWSFLGPVFLDAEAGLAVRILAKSFDFSSTTPAVVIPLYDVPVFALSAEGGLGAHFL
jgi:hypothetical protein